MSDENKGSSFATMSAAFAVGALVGVGLALLYAPKTGKETRELVGKKMRDIKGAAGSVIEEGKHLIQEGKQKAHEVYEKGKEVAHEIGGSADRNV